MIRLLSAGESHGMGLVGIIEGIPAGLQLDATYMDRQLYRRQQGYGRGGRMKIENDKVQILSGVRYSRTIGSPVSIMIENRDWINWQDQMAIDGLSQPSKKITLPRPGHADLPGLQKFGFDDIRPVIERASARETAMRVALGSIARKLLEVFGIEIGSHVVAIGSVVIDDTEKQKARKTSIKNLTKSADSSLVRSVSKPATEKMVEAIKRAQQQGDSLGGIFEIYADGVMPGLGSYTHWDKKLDGIIAQHCMSIQGIKGVQLGDAFLNAEKPGSQIHDGIHYLKSKGYYRKSNNSAGLEGGVTTGERIVVAAAMKPIPTLSKPLKSVDIKNKKSLPAFKERTDSCSVPSASIVGEAMLALALVNPFLEKFGGDSMSDIKKT